MNNQRRKAILDLIEWAEDLKAEIEDVWELEQDYYDNIPENLQNSERGENSQEAISALDDALSSLDDCISSLENCIEF